MNAFQVFNFLRVDLTNYPKFVIKQFNKIKIIWGKQKSWDYASQEGKKMRE
jgi:hypothetical protein